MTEKESREEYAARQSAADLDLIARAKRAQEAINDLGAGRRVTPVEHEHNPIQHRDGKPPWCNSCGLTADFTFPVSRFGIGANSLRWEAAQAAKHNAERIRREKQELEENLADLAGEGTLSLVLAQIESRARDWEHFSQDLLDPGRMAKEDSERVT